MSMKDEGQCATNIRRWIYYGLRLYVRHSGTLHDVSRLALHIRPPPWLFALPRVGRYRKLE